MQFNIVQDYINFCKENNIPLNADCALGADALNNKDMLWGTFVEFFNQKLQQDMYNDKDIFYSLLFKNVIPENSYNLILQKLADKYPETLYALFYIIIKEKYDFNNVGTDNLFDALSNEQKSIFVNTLKNNYTYYTALQNIPAVIPQWRDKTNETFYLQIPKTYKNISGFNTLTETELNSYGFYRCVNDIDVDRFYTGKFTFEFKDNLFYLYYEINKKLENIFNDEL